MLFHISKLVAVWNVAMNDSVSPFKHSQALLNDVVTNSRLSRDAAQVYLEDIDFTSRRPGRNITAEEQIPPAWIQMCTKQTINICKLQLNRVSTRPKMRQVFYWSSDVARAGLSASTRCSSSKQTKGGENNLAGCGHPSLCQRKDAKSAKRVIHTVHSNARCWSAQLAEGKSAQNGSQCAYQNMIDRSKVDCLVFSLVWSSYYYYNKLLYVNAINSLI